MVEGYRLPMERGEDRSDALRRMLQRALDEGAVDGVLCPVEPPSGRGVVTTYTTRKEFLERAEPMPMAINQFGPQNLVRLTEPGGGPARIAAVLKPCEARAVIELAKLKQVDLERVVLVSADCMGTVELVDYERAKDAKEGEVPQRFACTICRFPVPRPSVDLEVAIQGMPEDGLHLLANTEEGARLAKAAGAEEVRVPDAREKALREVHEAAEEMYDREEAASREKYSDIAVLDAELSVCIKCMNCMDVCPVCYCKECLFLTDAFNPTASVLADRAERKGTLRLPTDTMEFHLTRMAHVMTACVMCGQCQSACPSQIPLVEVYAGVNRRIQDLFDYEAGSDLEVAPPFTCFVEEEAFQVDAE